MGGAHLPVAFQFAGGGGIVLGQRQHALESRGSGARRLRIGIVGIQGSLTVLEITCEGGLVGLLLTLVGEAGIGSRGAVHADPVAGSQLMPISPDVYAVGSTAVRVAGSSSVGAGQTASIMVLPPGDKSWS